ncbi:MAG: hypothetical protein PVJ58_10040 [Chromatiales bacterium]|jgi:hypothetical protein
MKTATGLPESLAAWGTPEFEETFKREVGRLTAEMLPLQAALTHGSYACDSVNGVILLSTSESADSVIMKAGLHFTGVIAGCSCADDPTPNNETVEYCEVRIELDRKSARASIALLTDV